MTAAAITALWALSVAVILCFMSVATRGDGEARER